MQDQRCQLFYGNTTERFCASSQFIPTSVLVLIPLSLTVELDPVKNVIFPSPINVKLCHLSARGTVQEGKEVFSGSVFSCLPVLKTQSIQQQKGSSSSFIKVQQHAYEGLLENSSFLCGPGYSTTKFQSIGPEPRFPHGKLNATWAQGGTSLAVILSLSIQPQLKVMVTLLP